MKYRHCVQQNTHNFFLPTKPYKSSLLSETNSQLITFKDKMNLLLLLLLQHNLQIQNATCSPIIELNPPLPTFQLSGSTTSEPELQTTVTMR